MSMVRAPLPANLSHPVTARVRTDLASGCNLSASDETAFVRILSIEHRSTGSRFNRNLS
jgi:hypothetical protein